MKIIFTSLLLYCFASCAVTQSSSPVEVEKDPSAAQVEEVEHEGVAADELISGKVHVLYKGCPVLIEIMENDQMIKLYPVNLDESFKVEGLKIMFAYSPSRAPQPESCLLIDKVVSVQNVIKL